MVKLCQVSLFHNLFRIGKSSSIAFNFNFSQYQNHHSRCICTTSALTSSIAVSVVAPRKVLTERVKFFMGTYEDLIGIRQVREAHERVLDAEKEFLEAVEMRRNAHKNLLNCQNRLSQLRTELETVARGTARYLDLVTKEYGMINEEKELKSKFSEDEMRERECFQLLSNSLRSSHEKERAQAEKTKYWSFFASIAGIVLGILATIVSSSLKIKQLREVMAAREGVSLESLQNINGELELLTRKVDRISSFSQYPLTPLSPGESSGDIVLQSELPSSLTFIPTEWENRMDILERKVTRTLIVSSLVVALVICTTRFL